jgi:hypothetical protein
MLEEEKGMRGREIVGNEGVVGVRRGSDEHVCTCPGTKQMG